MSFLDKIKNFVNVDEDGYYPDDDVDTGAFLGDYEEEEKTVKQTRRAPRNSDEKVVNIHTTAQLQVVLAKPEKFDEVKSIAENLNVKRTVVLNLESVSRDVSRRLLDFLSGVAYANDGQIKPVANNTYIITPYNVDVMGDLLDELENNGMFF